MVNQWINFFLSITQDLIDFLDDFVLFGNVTVLGVLIAAAVAGILTATFLSIAHR